MCERESVCERYRKCVFVCVCVCVCVCMRAHVCLVDVTSRLVGGLLTCQKADKEVIIKHFFNFVCSMAAIQIKGIAKYGRFNDLCTLACL